MLVILYIFLVCYYIMMNHDDDKWWWKNSAMEAVCCFTSELSLHSSSSSSSSSSPFALRHSFASKFFCVFDPLILHSFVRVCPPSSFLQELCRTPWKTVQISTERSKGKSFLLLLLLIISDWSVRFSLLSFIYIFRHCLNKNVGRRIKTKKSF